jgi:hypothetical protein
LRSDILKKIEIADASAKFDTNSTASKSYKELVKIVLAKNDKKIDISKLPHYAMTKKINLHYKIYKGKQVYVDINGYPIL